MKTVEKVKKVKNEEIISGNDTLQFDLNGIIKEKYMMNVFIYIFMTKNVALSDDIVKELNKIKSEDESYTQVIRKLLEHQPKTDAERISKIFEPLKDGLCKLISPEMLYPIELFRVICIRIARKNKYKDDINKLVELLDEYLNGLK